MIILSAQAWAPEWSRKMPRSIRATASPSRIGMPCREVSFMSKIKKISAMYAISFDISSILEKPLVRSPLGFARQHDRLQAHIARSLLNAEFKAAVGGDLILLCTGDTRG